MHQKKNCHLVLSGGGIRGFAHIGVYKALVEYGYTITSVAGTSAGSLVGACIAAGKSPSEIEEIFCKQPLYKLLNVVFAKDGMLSMKRIQSILGETLGVTKIEQLALPFTVCAYDIKHCQPYYFQSGSIIPIVSGSCAVPGVFKPIVYEGKYLVDGGVYDNLPIDPHPDSAFMIASHVNPFNLRFQNTAQGVVGRAVRILISRNIEEQSKQCDLFIEPPKLASLGQAIFTNPRKIIKIGYDYTVALLRQSSPLSKKS